MSRLVSIQVSPDFVIIEGQRVNRPKWISPSEWLRYWERLQ